MIHTRDDRNTGFDGHLFGRNLITHGIHDVFGRPDEYDTCLFTGFNKVWILREKTVARMNGINICLFGNFNNTFDVQISINRTFIFFQLIGFICFGTEESIAVFLGIDTDGCNTQLIQSTINTDCDFTAVSDENTFEWFDLYFSHFEKPPFLTLQIQSVIPLIFVLRITAGMLSVVSSVLHTYIFTIRYGLFKCKR